MYLSSKTSNKLVAESIDLTRHDSSAGNPRLPDLEANEACAAEGCLGEKYDLATKSGMRSISASAQCRFIDCISASDFWLVVDFGAFAASAEVAAGDDFGNVLFGKTAARTFRRITGTWAESRSLLWKVWDKYLTSVSGGHHGTLAR